MAEKWNLTGSYFESCNCEVACPCIFLNAPTEGDCKLLVGWHIENGKNGDVSLNGLNVALAVYSPGHMAQTKWKVALYVDERASEAQKNALVQIYSGQAGGYFASISPFIGEMLGVTSTKIDYHEAGKNRTLSLGNVANMAIDGIEGQNGADVTVQNPPLTLVPGIPATVAKSTQLRYSDHSMNWNISGKNGFYSKFAYQAG
jgi:hypothetical protein